METARFEGTREQSEVDLRGTIYRGRANVRSAESAPFPRMKRDLVWAADRRSPCLINDFRDFLGRARQLVPIRPSGVLAILVLPTSGGSVVCT